MKSFSNFIALSIALTACGCVERIMTIQSDPPGALVTLNQLEVGRTPMQKNFTWYGKYDVILRKEGCETLKTTGAVYPPVWQWPVIDLFFELLPLHLKDEHKLQYSLKPQSSADVDTILDRAVELRSELESSQHTITPATQPTTHPAHAPKRSRIP